jgi:hypothetical protein
VTNMNDEHVITWLLEGDPAIRWQVYADLLDAEAGVVAAERARVASEGWGAALLARQAPDGQWGSGLYSPKWTSTTYTLLLLRDLGLMPGNEQALAGCRLLLDHGLYDDGGINFWKSHKHSETCVTSMVLSILAYFELPDERVDRLVVHLLEQQMADGGWNCRRIRGAVHSSFNTTILALEGLWHYCHTHQEQASELSQAEARGREFLLQHRLYRSDKTGNIVNSAFKRFAFPTRWHHDVLRALDYWQASRSIHDERLVDGIHLTKEKRNPDGTWNLDYRYSGKTFFELERVGKPSRWNTLRALRVLKWWEAV